MKLAVLLTMLGAATLADDPDFDFNFSGYEKVEGDLYQAKNAPGGLASATSRAFAKWPNAVVPYQIDSKFNSAEKIKVFDAMKEIQAKTCIRFRPATRADRDVTIITQRYEGCYSDSVGRKGGRQNMNLQTQGCTSRSTILHELMHVLGFEHEHMRPDRDQYVEVLYQNIQNDNRDQFDRRRKSQMNLLNTGYSYNTIMHYTISAFNRFNDREDDEEHPVFKLLKQNSGKVGGEDRLSDIDVERLNKLYCGAQG